MKTQETNLGVISGLILLLFAGLYLILAGLVTHTWPFASKPTCGNTDGKGKAFTCEGDSKKLNNDVTCATSPCTEKECCTDSGPSPPPPPPPTPPSAVCKNTTQGGHGWNAIKGCEKANCENLKGDCSAGKQGTRQCYKWTLPYGTCSISDDSTPSDLKSAQESCSNRGDEKDCKNKNYDKNLENLDCKWTPDPTNGNCQALESPPDACLNSKNLGGCEFKEDKDLLIERFIETYGFTYVE